ncbi:MAG: Fe-S cluster assembly protein SufD [Parachlamydiaceae bacterium]|nr:Fe-S cluster assembly protein SufD [Parachlamydiaceae bacterium]
MMTEQKFESDLVKSLLENIYNQIAKTDVLGPLRTKSWESFQKLGLPQRKDELFRYINLNRFYSNEYTPAESKDLQKSDIEQFILPECGNSTLVFVNGDFQPELSQMSALPKKMIVCRLSEAMRTYGALITNQWARSNKDEVDPFVAINGASHGEGAFIYMPPNVICEAPIQLLYVVDAPDLRAMIMPRLHVFAGTQSSIKMIATHRAISGQGYCVNQVTEISLEDNAHVHLSQVNQPSADDIYHFDAVRAFLKRDSNLKTVALTHGSMSVRNDYKISLFGENSHACLNGVWTLNDKREAHTHVLMEHIAPNCTSNQLFKGVLYDYSHSSFDGKIIVEQLAQKTNAFQLNNNLLLSDGAKAESSPNLKIYADDVKASHGATIGQLPAEELFYMRTRGLTEKDAREILVAGFCQEVYDMLLLDSVRP